MLEESDGVDEALVDQVRVAVTAAGLVAEGLARGREERQKRAQAVGEQQARELQSRLDADRRAALAELALLNRPEWWNRATPEQVGRAWQTARAWAHEAPGAEQAAQRIADELRSRYGVDPMGTGIDLRGARTDAAEAELLLLQAEQQDRHSTASRKAEVRAEAGSGPATASQWDSAQRRAQTARELEAAGVGREALTAKMAADVSQAAPAADAIRHVNPARSARARKSRGRGTQVERSLQQR